MEQGLPGSGIAHIERIAALDNRVRDEVVIHEGLDGPDADIRWDVAGLELAQELVDVEPVADLDRDLGKVFMAAVHRVAELKGGNGAPALFLEDSAGFGRTLVDTAELPREIRLAEDLNRPCEVHVLLFQDHLDAGVGRVIRLEDLLALVRLVDGVFLGDLEDAYDLRGFAADQRDLIAFADAVGRSLVGRQRDRDRPEQPPGQLHAVAHTLPVGPVHEALQRGKAADAEHDQVARLTAGDGYLRQGPGPLQGLLPGRTAQESGFELGRAVRGDELGHRRYSFRGCGRTPAPV